jgi:hypothetical protein
MDKKSNLLSFEDAKSKRVFKQTVQGYKEYLKCLPFEQLPYEIRFLIDEFKSHQYGQDYFVKGQLVLQELALRSTDENCKVLIEQMGPVLAKQINQVFGGPRTL